MAVIKIGDLVVTKECLKNFQDRSGSYYLMKVVSFQKDKFFSGEILDYSGRFSHLRKGQKYSYLTLENYVAVSPTNQFIKLEELDC